MKKLSDGHLVPYRMYMYLVEYTSSTDQVDIIAQTGKLLIFQLTLPEFMSLFNLATSKDLQQYK